MRKSIGIILGLMLVFGLSLNLSAQSDEELDQVKLLKQLVGTWQADLGQDTVVIIKNTQTGTGMYTIQENKAKGETYNTTIGLTGFSEDKQFIIGIALWQDGGVSQDIGQFISPKKFVSERFGNDQKHAMMLVEIEFKSPEQWIWRGKWRGVKMEWPEEWHIKATFNKVN